MSLEEQIQALDSKIVALESKITSVEVLLDKVDARLDSGQSLRPSDLRAELLQEGLRLDLLTGTIDEGAKQVVMDKFRSGEVQVLVATTVVEVGVDVADATFVMLVESAERFGLTVLHRIRGRVGRGRRPGRCHLLWGPVKEDGRDRLAEKMQVLVETADGLEVAERDKEARGAGDVQSRGSAQSGVGGEGVSPAKARGFDGEGVDLSPKELRRLVEESREAAMRVVLTPRSANNHPALAYGLMLHGLQPARRTAAWGGKTRSNDWRLLSVLTCCSRAAGSCCGRRRRRSGRRSVVE